jgi:alkaline phosphatase D
MVSMKRRTFLGWLAATPGLSLLGSACTSEDPEDAMFPQGVASGDPRPDGVLLWTRVESTSTERVRFEVASDPDFTAIVTTSTMPPITRCASMSPTSRPERPTGIASPCVA